MTYSPYEPAPPERDGWNLNLPLAIGVVFVFLVGVIAWVIVSSNRADDGTAPPPTPPTVGSTVPSGPPIDANTTTTAVTSTTTPPLMPTTTVPGGTATVPPTAPADPTATTVASAEPTPTPVPTAAPAPTTTTEPRAPGDTVPGDLGVEGVDMAEPVCGGEYITIIASAIGDQASAVGIGRILDEYPGSSYLRTDQACSSLSQSSQGQPIYVVFFGPYPMASDACAARADGPSDAYAKQLLDSGGVTGAVDCSA